MICSTHVNIPMSARPMSSCCHQDLQVIGRFRNPTSSEKSKKIWINIGPIFDSTNSRSPRFEPLTAFCFSQPKVERSTSEARWIRTTRTGGTRRSSTWRSSAPSTRTSTDTSATRSSRNFSSLATFRWFFGPYAILLIATSPIRALNSAYMCFTSRSHRSCDLDFFPKPMPQMGIELTSVSSVTSLWGTLIQDASPPELSRPLLTPHNSYFSPFKPQTDNLLPKAQFLFHPITFPRKVKPNIFHQKKLWWLDLNPRTPFHRLHYTASHLAATTPLIWSFGPYF